jgi:hypothetical protein
MNKSSTATIIVSTLLIVGFIYSPVWTGLILVGSIFLFGLGIMAWCSILGVNQFFADRFNEESWEEKLRKREHRRYLR